MTCDVGNPSLGLRQAQICDRVKPFNGITTLFPYTIQFAYFYTPHKIVWGHIVFRFVCSFVRPALLCKCSSSQVLGPIALIFGRMIGHDVWLIILFHHFCRSYGTLSFSCNFKIGIHCECYFSEVVVPIAIIYDMMIGWANSCHI